MHDYNHIFNIIRNASKSMKMLLLKLKIGLKIILGQALIASNSIKAH